MQITYLVFNNKHILISQMDYSKFFNSELEKLKKEGLYRKFREIDRPIKKFPKADETQGEIERD